MLPQEQILWHFLFQNVKKAPRGKPLEALILLHLSIIRY
nr:MAG TPA: hypothetical protein [Caudoviricetes sp.]